jgi:hypothetical protein
MAANTGRSGQPVQKAGGRGGSGPSAGFEALDYDLRFGYYRLPLQKEDVAQKRGQLKQLIEAA